jgi:predicted P-loop ATPase
MSANEKPLRAATPSGLKNIETLDETNIDAGKIQETFGDLDSPPMVPCDDTWRARLLMGEHDTPKAILANAIIALRDAPQWQGVLGFDLFAVRHMALKPPPWQRGHNNWKPREWTDHDDVLAASWLQHEGIIVGEGVAGTAANAVAHGRSFHPVRDYLGGLQWDGEPRIDQFAATYFGADPTAYGIAIGSKFLIQAVARVERPGCQADSALILEGDQGAKKSSALRLLTEPWFTDDIAELGTKASAEQTAGVWVIEIAELDSMKRPEVTRVKAFLSRRVDRYRPAYGRRVAEFPRQCVFTGSTNLPEYLKDETGARRFWPMDAPRIDLDRIAADRDQLWAEAVVRFRAGESWWLKSGAEIAAAKSETDARYVGDVWDNRIAAYIADREFVTVAEVLQHAINLPLERCGQIEQNRVARSLRSFSLRRKQRRVGGRREWYYTPDGD